MDQGPLLHPERLPVGRSVSGIIVAGGWRDTSAHDTKAPHVQPSHGRSSDVMLSMRGTLGKPQEGKVVAHVRPLFIPRRTRTRWSQDASSCATAPPR